EAYLKPESTEMDLPDVKDIPGQEFIRPPDPKAFADTTISSADEEGKNVEGLMDRDEADLNDETNVSREERELLEQSVDSMSSEDDIARRQATLDNTDDDNEPLNQNVDASGHDLDVPGAEADDENEEIGEEDEENNSYSLGGDRD
ncbi:MAG TPA: hypothetical protein VF476_03220, partial [Chitinophagaceae bacterium]